ncbi:FimV/HubP family polar landmark protein [Marinobacterium lutimaris]|uniref:Pilus assembly protein FimV n=1 Tax=Marinobacterium lutimaris TaxID=568106 RepID=A0A1H5UQP7_9GAMM|nr:FimV/HubP family polar landmark protein [Marinobacterium lutimaris]SEF77340.1 pilus assembly protein FimV [Marinobacterium lutimaris]
MLRKLALSLAVAGALSATQANALGLGAIQVNSALNEPLNAEIKLLQVRDLSPLQIQPRMADIDEFSLAGISKSRFLSDVKFDVRVMPDGTGVIRLNSSTPIKEPFLNFLVEVNWPSGRLVREYTLLLDPPLFDPTPAPGTQVVQPAQTVAPAAPATQQVAPGTSFAAPSRPADVSNIKTRANPNTEVYVDVDDTLWELALEHRPNRSVTPEQMMIALQRKNPQSFPGGNINMLKAGTVMRLPTLEEIKQLSAAEAKAEARRQTEVWRNRGSSAPAPAPEAAATDDAAPVETSSDSGTAAGEASDGDSQLKVVAPETPAESDQASTASSDDSQSTEDAAVVAEEGAGSAEGVVDAQDLAGRNEELENRLLLTQESVAKVELENNELNEKLDAIVSQLDKMQQLIELKDRELAMMQQQLDQRDATDEETAGFIDQMLKNPAYLAGAGGAVLLAFLLGLLLARRGKGKEDKAVEVREASEPKPKAPVDSADSDAIPDMAIAAAAGAAGAAVAASAAADESEPESELQAKADNDLADDDLSDLDLDMDLDLDEAVEETEAAESISDDEFDLGVDELEEPAPVAEDDSLDTGLDDLLAENDSDDELPGALDDDLSDLDLAPDEPLVATESEEVAEPELEADELDFAVNGFGEDEADEEDDLIDLPDDLEFAVSQPGAETSEETEPESEEDELAGLDFAVDNSAGTLDGEDGDDDLLEDFFSEEVESKDEFSSLSETSDEDVAPLTDESVDVDTLEDTFSLGTVEPLTEPDDSAVDDALDEMLLNSYGDEEEDETGTAAAAAGNSVDEDDLDALLASFEPEEEEEFKPQMRPGERVEEELTANIAHDLETDLDAELDELLDSTDDEIALEEENATESSDLADDPLDSLNLLEGADENETKLDLARAYIEMEDREGAKDILNEILGEGNHFQRREAQRLLDSLNG